MPKKISWELECGTTTKCNHFIKDIECISLAPWQWVYATYWGCIGGKLQIMVDI